MYVPLKKEKEKEKGRAYRTRDGSSRGSGAAWDTLTSNTVIILDYAFFVARTAEKQSYVRILAVVKRPAGVGTVRKSLNSTGAVRGCGLVRKSVP
jgi:hypothetical protein